MKSSDSNMNGENIVPSVDKMIVLLGYLARKTGGATQVELMKQARLSASTCYRILQTLRKHDWVRQREGNAYDLSSGLLPIVLKLCSRTLRLQDAQPVLERLTAATGLAAKLSVRQGDEQVTILRAESPRPLSVSGKVGGRFPVIEGTVGAALLAGLSSGEIEDLVAGCEEKITERMTPGLVLRRKDDLARQGFCMLTSAQNRWKVAALSMPVRGAGAQVAAAVTLLGMDEDFEGRRLARLTEALRAAAAECEALLD